MRALLILLLIACVGSCATQQHSLVIQTGGGYGVPGTSKVDMLVMSTRKRSSMHDAIYTGERAEHHSLYHLVISIPPDKFRRIGDVQWPRGPKANPRTDFVTVTARDMSPADVDRWFVKVAGKKRKLLVFVHGYNNTFELGGVQACTDSP